MATQVPGEINPDQISDFTRELADRLKRGLDHYMPRPAASSRSICEVPHKMKQKNESEYTPEMVSIGPLHILYSFGAIDTSQKLKLPYMNALLNRTGNAVPKLQHCIEAIHRRVDEARSYYPPFFPNDDDRFIAIMVVDGLFTIELFRKSVWEVPIEKDDPIFNTWGVSSLIRDMMLLENQLPMFVLETLFNITTANLGGRSLNELAIRFINPLMHRNEEVLQNCFQDKTGKRLLDLLCKSFKDIPQQTRIVQNVQVQLAPSATELQVAGVKFGKASVGRSFLDISFANGVLNIPPIQIKDQTESLLLNFIAWEHCCDDESDTCITSYVILMDNLINTANDVEVLRKSGIIRTYKTNDECVSLFKKLTNEVFVCNFYYSDLCKALTIYNDQWHVGTTELPTRRAIEGCFECGDPSHWKEACPWIRFPCAKGPYSGCPGTMKIYTSWQDHSKGRRFMTCQHPGCNGFIWVDMVAPYWFDDDECSNHKGKGKNEDNGRSVKEDNKEEERGNIKEEERGNIKLQLHGKIPMTLEGNVDDICRCVKNLEL